MAQQNQLSKPNFPELSGPMKLWLSQLTDTVNSLGGYNGVIKLNNHLDLGGSQVKNIGDPTDSGDAVSHGVAQGSYSATALRPQLESTGTTPLKSVRRLNDQNQREATSSFLNDLHSTPPSANQIVPSITNMGGGVQVTIPSSPFTFADRSVVMLEGRTDLLSFATSVSITSISSSGNVVTVVTSGPSGAVVGSGVTIRGVSPPSFNGSYTVTRVISSTSFTYQSDLGTLSGSGGFVDTQNCYYYTVYKRQNQLTLIGPVSGDTANNRLQAAYDGYAIVAVILVTSTGATIASSGGGGSPITGSVCAGSMF